MIRRQIWPTEVEKIMKDSKKGPLIERRLVDNQSAKRPDRDSLLGFTDRD